MSELLISFCIPTNGVIEWVFPVLESIFNQNIDEALFEVIVTDNGNNAEFFSKMTDYLKKHRNLVYKKTNEPLFLNEIAAYRCAHGKFIKFLNHRTMMKAGTLSRFLSFVQEYQCIKPIVYFANGGLKQKSEISAYNNFDEFVSGLSYLSSWSTGMGFWKEDFDSLPLNEVYNELFPHTTILFHERKREKYIIDNRELLYEMPVGNISKGRYDLFFAFAVEYPAIICDLLRTGDISYDTFLHVKKETLYFIMNLYFEYVIRKQKCSYDLSSYNNSIKVFYNRQNTTTCLAGLIFKHTVRKLKRLVFDRKK